MRRNRRQRRPSVEVYQRVEEFNRVAMQDYYTIRQLGNNIRAQFQQEYFIGASYACYALGIAIVDDKDMQDQTNSTSKKWPLIMQFGSKATEAHNVNPNPPAVGSYIMVTEYRPMERVAYRDRAGAFADPLPVIRPNEVQKANGVATKYQIRNRMTATALRLLRPETAVITYSSTSELLPIKLL